MTAIASWHEEQQSAWLYHRMVEVETDPGKRALFAALADAALSQARIWEAELARQDAKPPRFRPSARARVVAWLLRRLGPRAIRPVLAAMKVRGMSLYGSHGVPAGHVMPTSVEEVGHRHRGVGSGGNLRAAVFGVNDGLVSNTSLIMGMAGASLDGRLVLLSGVAGLLAGAFSMAAGEYVSMRSQREMYQYQIGMERDELEKYPDEEAEELALIYNARGMDLHTARAFATDLLREPQHALDTLAREELGLNPDDLGSPWGAALSSFLAFGAGALIPLLPFVLRLQTQAVPVAAALAATSLFAVGATLSLFTGRSAVSGGLRMLVIGGAAGGATFALGGLLGVQLG